MVRGQRGERETLELVPLSRGGEALFVAERKLDEARVLECSLDLGQRRVEQLRDVRGRHREAVLKIEQGLDRAGAERSAKRVEIGEIEVERLARAPAERVEHHATAE